MKNAATRRGNNLVSIRFRLPFDYSRITPGHVKLIRLADSTCLRIERTIIGRICRMELVDEPCLLHDRCCIFVAGKKRICQIDENDKCKCARRRMFAISGKIIVVKECVI